MSSVEIESIWSSISSEDADQVNIPNQLVSSYVDDINHHPPEENFAMDMETSRFSAINPESISKLVRRKDLKLLRNCGGVEGIVSVLETDTETGIPGDPNDINERRKTFGSNLFPNQSLPCGFGNAAFESLKDPMILVLLICSFLSLFFGIKKHGLKKGCQEGLARLAAIFATALISSAGKFWPTYQSLLFSNISSEIAEVEVVRNGNWQQIHIGHVVVGDIVFLKPGDQVPADGLFIEGCSLYIETQRIDGQVQMERTHENPFLSFGGTVVKGYAKMVVTAVGKNKTQHTICLRGRLFDEMEKVTFAVEKIVQAVAWMIFLMLIWEFFAENYIHDKKGNVWIVMVRIVATPLMIALTSKPEALVMAVQIGFAYSMETMMRIKVLVRDPSACHSLASLTTLCISKTGT